MPPRYGLSPWLSQFPAHRRPSFPKYRGDHDAGVVIVGGGLTGCATAQAAAAAGHAPLLLEAERLGSNSTALESGLLLPEPGPLFRDVVQAHGRRTATRVFTSWRRAALDAAALLRRLRIRCGLEPLDSLITAHPAVEKALRREYDARREAGLDLVWLDERRARALTRDDTAGAIRQAGAFALDPYRACLGLAAAAKSRGAVIYESSPVKKIRVGRRSVEIITDGGIVRAETVIVATGQPTSLFGPLRRHFAARGGVRVLTEPMPAAVRRQVAVSTAALRDSHQPPHRIRWTDDHRALIGGAEQSEVPPRKRDAFIRHWTYELMYEFLKMYPAIAGLQPAYGWYMSSVCGRDGLPSIGPHRNYPRHLFALGDTESVTGSFLAARILVRALEGSADPADEAFGFTR